MTFELNQLTCKNEKVLSHLRAYLARIETYSNFDYGMSVRIFVTSDYDFIAFEAVDFMLGFTSSAHKLTEISRSHFSPLVTDYRSFMLVVSHL